MFAIKSLIFFGILVAAVCITRVDGTEEEDIQAAREHVRASASEAMGLLRRALTASQPSRASRQKRGASVTLGGQSTGTMTGGVNQVLSEKCLIFLPDGTIVTVRCDDIVSSLSMGGH